MPTCHDWCCRRSWHRSGQCCNTLSAVVTAAFLLQDIAVDGWALTLLPPHHIEYASTCQTLGMNTGYFMSFTIFLALSSTEFCNQYIRSSRLAGRQGAGGGGVGWKHTMC